MGNRWSSPMSHCPETTSGSDRRPTNPRMSGFVVLPLRTALARLLADMVSGEGGQSGIALLRPAYDALGPDRYKSPLQAREGHGFAGLKVVEPENAVHLPRKCKGPFSSYSPLRCQPHKCSDDGFRGDLRPFVGSVACCVRLTVQVERQDWRSIRIQNPAGDAFQLLASSQPHHSCRFSHDLFCVRRFTPNTATDETLSERASIYSAIYRRTHPLKFSFNIPTTCVDHGLRTVTVHIHTCTCELRCACWCRGSRGLFSLHISRP